MGNNSTNINKTNNNLSPKEILNSLGNFVFEVMGNDSFNINKTNNNLSPKESLRSEGPQFHQYQQNKQ